MSQDFSFSWFNFTEHLHHLFADLYKEESYADVTLVSSDQFEFKAHKIVLSACSPVLKKIIDDNHGDLPLVYQTKIKSQEMEAILHFIYMGKGKFYQERMEEFIKAAKDLELKHFCEILETQNCDVDTADTAYKNTALNTERYESGKIYKDRNGEISEGGKMLSGKMGKIRQRQPRNQISSDVKSTECPECGKEFNLKNNMLKHYRSVHEGIKYPCNQCDY